jgi:hypothetical protein
VIGPHLIGHSRSQFAVLELEMLQEIQTSLCFRDLYDASSFEILVGSLTVHRNSIISISELVR